MPEQLDDTLIHLQKSGESPPLATWEISVPNGDYLVSMKAGDPSSSDGFFHLTAEGLTVLSGQPQWNQKWISGTDRVTVTDGKLTITSGASAQNNKINYIVIEPARLRVSDYGVVADDAVDDFPALDALIAAAKPKSTLVFDEGTYYLSERLFFDKPISIDGGGATLVHRNQYAWPLNYALFYQSAIQDYSTGGTWQESIAADQTTFAVSVPSQELWAGDLVFVELGEDPYDAAEQHFTTIARIVSNNGTSVTIDRPVPYTINQGNRLHKISKVTSLIEDVTISNLSFDWANSIPDAQIWLERVQNVAVDTIGGRFTIAVHPVDSDDVTVSHVSGDLVHIPGHSSSGRLITAWQTDGLTLSDSEVYTDSGASVVLLESHARGTSVNDLTVHWDHVGTPVAGVFHIVGGSSDTEVNNLVIDNGTVNDDRSVILLSTGAEPYPAEEIFDAFISGKIKHVPLAQVRVLRTNAYEFDAASTTHASLDVEVQSDWYYHFVNLVGGVIRNWTISANSVQGINEVHLSNFGAWLGYQIVPGLQANQPLEHWESIGSDYPFNALLDITGADAPQKLFRFIDTDTVAPGTVVHIELDYWSPATYTL